jgi:hypothetical protein
MKHITDNGLSLIHVATHHLPLKKNVHVHQKINTDRPTCKTHMFIDETQIKKIKNTLKICLQLKQEKKYWQNIYR